MASPSGTVRALLFLSLLFLATAIDSLETTGPFCCYHEISRAGNEKQCTTLAAPDSWCSQTAERCLNNCSGVFHQAKNGKVTRRSDEKNEPPKEPGYCCFYKRGSKCTTKSSPDSWCSHSSKRCEENCEGTWFPAGGETAPEPEKPAAPPSVSAAPVPSVSAAPSEAPRPPARKPEPPVISPPTVSAVPQPSSNPPASDPDPPVIAPTVPSSEADPPILPLPSPSAAPPPAITTPEPGAGGCAPPAFFCEDFESPLRASLQLDGDAAVASAGARGGKALHLTPDGGGKGRLIAKGVLPGNSFYGRMYARVAKYPTAPVYSHWVLAEAFADEKGTEQVRPLGGQYIEENGKGENRWGVGADGGPSGDWTAHKETVPATDGEWQCLEWQLEDTGKDNFVRVWIDGVAKTEMTQSRFENGSGKEFVFPKLRNVWFGWWNFQGDTTPAKFDVYIDDIVLSTERVGCL